MRFVFVAALMALVSIAGLPSASAASARGGDREMGSTDGAARWTTEGRPRFERRKIARATVRDFEEDDYEAAPRRKYSTDRADTRRYTKSRRARTAKRARRHRQATRRSTGRRSQRTRRAAPAARNGGTYGYTGGQEGVASYYWQGQRVASGGWFNPEGMTAAHRTLPFGTRVRVTHLGNGRSVTVKINDRGPFIAGRIIDLSRGAARVIGMTGQGLARVKVTVLGR